MQDIKEILKRIEESKKRRKELKTQVYGELKDSKPYEDACIELASWKNKKKAFETETLNHFPDQAKELDDLNTSIKEDLQMLSDIALTNYMKGESISIRDEEGGVEYEQRFKVAFQMRLL